MGLLDYISDDNDIRTIIGTFMFLCSLVCIITCIYKFAICQHNINSNQSYHNSSHHKICNNRNDMINLHNNYNDL